MGREIRYTTNLKTNGMSTENEVCIKFLHIVYVQSSFRPIKLSRDVRRSPRELCVIPARFEPKLQRIQSYILTLRLLMSYIYGAPSKARNVNVVYIWTYVWQR